MAQLPSVFKSDEHEKKGDFSCIPDGTKVLVAITKSEIKPTKAGDGKRLLLHLKVQEGDYKGKIIFLGLNIQNPNDIAQKIAQEELAAICEVCGKKVIKDSVELHGIPFYATVGIESSEGYPDKNNVKKYEGAGLGGGSAPTKNPFK